MRSPRRRASAIAGLALVAAGVAATWVFALGSGSNALRAPDAVDLPRVPVPADPSQPAASAAGASAAGTENEPIAGARASAQAGRDVEVRVIDEADQPVAGAMVRVHGPIPLQLPATVEWGPTAVTDANGRVVLHGVREGQWFATAEHDGLVFSSLQQTLQGPLLALGNTATTVRLVEPYVSGIRVRGGELLHHQFDWSGGVFERVEDAPSMQPVLQRLEQRWPGARFAFWVRSLEAEYYGATGTRCGALVIANGRERWTGTVEPVRLGEFQGPLEIDAAQLTHSDDFGTLVLRALDVGGDVTKGLAVNLGQGSGCDLRLNRRIENGDEVTLPCGNYSLRGDEPFLQQMLPTGVTVERGSRCAIDLGVRLLTRCEIELVGPPTTSWVRLQHATLREPVDHRLHGRGTLAYWLPEGTVTATFFAHEGGASGPLSFAEQMSSVEVGHSAPVAVGGGTLATPQHVVLSPVARR